MTGINSQDSPPLVPAKEYPDSARVYGKVMTSA